MASVIVWTRNRQRRRTQAEARKSQETKDR
jgi:hypothetical protein